MITATLDAVSEQATTLCKKDQFRFVVDEPVKLGGRDLGANPLATFLGGLLGCTAYTMNNVAKEMKMSISRVSWETSGQFDFRGLRGHPEVDASFQKLNVVGTVDCDGSQESLDALAEAVERRCILAATLRRAQGLDMHLTLKKGSLQPDTELHQLYDKHGLK